MTCWEHLHRDMEKCRLCPRWMRRDIDTPFFGVGNLNSKVMFVGQSPGRQKGLGDALVFSGNQTGLYFMKTITRAGFHFGNCYITNAVKCQDRNEEPVDLEVNACNDHLLVEIAKVKPLLIVTLGNVAAKAVQRALRKLKMFREITVRKYKHPSWISRFATSPEKKEYQDQFNELFAEVIASRSN